MADRVKLVLDTDIGSDVDDAIALSYLLSREDCDLLGITTVSGDVAQRAACAEVLCRAAGREGIAIHTGTSNVLLVGAGQPTVPNYKAVARHAHRLDWPAGTAVEFLRHTIREHAGEVTLLCTGPLTNIALLFAIDPEIPQMLRGLVTMNGLFFGPENRHELNALVDPFSAAIVYNAHARNHTCIGMDVTHGCGLTVGQVRQHFLSPALKLVCEMADDWMSSPRDFFLNDTVAAVSVFAPGLCQYQTGTVTMPISADATRAGTTHFDPGSKGPHRVAKAIDVQGFQTELLGTLASRPRRMAV
jgi:purine nucleosidase